MSGRALLGLAIVVATIAFAFFLLFQGRNVPPSGRRHRDWMRQVFGNPRLPGDRDLQEKQRDRLEGE
jgi:hypothetical protein